MLALVISGNVFGAFNSIAELADRYVCDGVEMQFSVIGGNAFIYVWLGGRWRSGSLA